MPDYRLGRKAWSLLAGNTVSNIKTTPIQRCNSRSHFLPNFCLAAAVPAFFSTCGFAFAKRERLPQLFLSIATIYFALFSYGLLLFGLQEALLGGETRISFKKLFFCGLGRVF